MTREPFAATMLAPLRPLAIAILLLAPFAVAVTPPSLTTAPILAVFDPGDATVASLVAAGYQPCGAVVTGACFEAVDALGLAAASFDDRVLLYVGSQTLPSAAFDALVARADDIETFLAAGGSIVALAAPNGAEYDYLPDNPYGINFHPGANPDYQWADAEAIGLTPFGYGHPAMAGLTNASLSNWDPSVSNVFLEAPGWLYQTARITLPSQFGDFMWPSTYAGNYFAGCGVLTSQPADLLIAGLHGDAGRAADAAQMIRAHVEWGLACTQVPPPPLPYAGGIRITGSPAGVEEVHTPNLDCSPVVFSGAFRTVTCTPVAPPPPHSSGWACYGATVLASGIGINSLEGSMSCGNVVAECSAPISTVRGRSVGTCSEVTGIEEIGPFPVRCRAKATTQDDHVWSVTCGSFDP